MSHQNHSSALERSTGIPLVGSWIRRGAAAWRGTSPASAIFRNMSTLASGALLVRLLGALSAPIVTRIYSPEHFGVLSAFMALTAILVPFGSLRYAMAVPLPRRDGVAATLFASSLILLLLLAGLVGCVLAVFARPVLAALAMDSLAPFWWLLPLAIAGIGLYELLSQWAVRERAFKPIAATQAWQTVIGFVAKVGLGLLGLKPIGLLLGTVASQAGGCGSLYVRFKATLRPQMRHFTPRRALRLLRHYADFPIYRLPSQVILAFAAKMPVLYFARFFGDAAVGHLGLTMAMVAIPMEFFGTTTGKAYYAEVAKIGRVHPGPIYDLTRNVTRKLLAVSLLPALVLLLAGPSLFGLVFGAEWAPAGQLASAWSINLLTIFITEPIASVLNVFNRQKYYLQINTVRLVLAGLAFLLSYALHLNPLQTAWAYGLVLSAHRIYVYFYIMAMIRREIAARAG